MEWGRVVGLGVAGVARGQEYMQVRVGWLWDMPGYWRQDDRVVGGWV